MSASSRGCPAGMVVIGGRFCIDPYEAAVEELDDQGKTVGIFPHNRGIEGKAVRAVSHRGLVPQTHASREDAARACERAGKRLCSGEEWLRACKGPGETLFPYGTRHRRGMCNDEGVSSLRLLYGPSPPHDLRTMNDPRLTEVAGTVARTGIFSRCASEEGVFDMVGNVHEWTSAPGGIFRGGYFLDTKTLGDGCDYSTQGHGPSYRDYSTGFRCCADLR